MNASHQTLGRRFRFPVESGRDPIVAEPLPSFPSPMTDPVSAAPEDHPTPGSPEALPNALPDRADAPVSEVAERFLRVVIAEVPLELIEELHLFSPLRQGTQETGIAVLAARVPEAAAEAAPVAAESTGEPELFEGEEEVVAAVADAATEAVGEERSDETPNEGDEAAAMVLPDEAVAKPVRHTVYTARYRYIIKGPERGKWEASIKAEADAPLVTVETVVRGVQRRAGEESEIVRYTATQLARALRVTLPASLPA